MKHKTILETADTKVASHRCAVLHQPFLIAENFDMKQLLYLWPFCKKMQLLLLEPPVHTGYNKSRVVMSHGLGHMLSKMPLKNRFVRGPICPLDLVCALVWASLLISLFFGYMYLSVCVHSRLFSTCCWNETLLHLPRFKFFFTGWLSDRHLECPQLHSASVCAWVCVMHTELHVTYCYRESSTSSLACFFVCLAPSVSFASTCMPEESLRRGERSSNQGAWCLRGL